MTHHIQFRRFAVFFMVLCFAMELSLAQTQTKMSFVVSASRPAEHLYHVQLKYTAANAKTLHFRMSAWTPGFYEIKYYGEHVSAFKATDASGKTLKWKLAADSTWEVHPHPGRAVVINYDVKADDPFIANANLDEEYGYFVPGAVMIYLDETLRKPLTVTIKPYKTWPQQVATGLDEIPGKPNTYLVSNFDVLYDSPFLMGKLEDFPTSSVQGKPLRFTGFNMGIKNRKLFMADLAKIAAAAGDIIGDVPFNHYTFLGIGMRGHGFGGIEHLNSSSLLMANDSVYLAQPATKETMYSFLAHEYFHLYNVKRIRPIELGPFDYSKENYTNLLWVSEGFTDYYEYLIMRRAGLLSRERVLANYQEHISSYENTSGHLYQSLIQSSRGIWAQRGIPQQRTPEEVAKTISVYDKGCVLGMLIDLKIRHETQNKKSLDDVMRGLYKTYYQQKKRGFTDHEFQQECEATAGMALTELFSYVTSVTPVNYPKYLAYAGLSIDTVNRALPALTMGAEVRYSKTDSSLVVTSITWPSSAFEAGLKMGNHILRIGGKKISPQLYGQLMTTAHVGDELALEVISNQTARKLNVKLSTHYVKSFAIKAVDQPDALQKSIYESWLR